MPISSGASGWSEDYNYRNSTERDLSSPRKSAKKYQHSGYSEQNRHFLDHLPTWNDYISPYSLPLPRVHAPVCKKKKKRRKRKRKKDIAAENNSSDESDPVSGNREKVVLSPKVQKRSTTAPTQNDEQKLLGETNLTIPVSEKRSTVISTKPGETKNPGANKKQKQQKDRCVENNEDQRNDTKFFGQDDKEEINSETCKENNNSSNSNQSQQFHDRVFLSEPGKDQDNDHVEERNHKETKEATGKQCKQSKPRKKCRDKGTKSTGGNNDELQRNDERKCRFKDNKMEPHNNRKESKVNDSGHEAQQTEIPTDTATCRRYNESRNDEIDRANGNCSDNQEEHMSPRKCPEKPQVVSKNFIKNEINSEGEKKKEKTENIEEAKQKDAEIQDTNNDGKSSGKLPGIRTQKKKYWNKVKHTIKATSRRKNSDDVKNPSKLEKLTENREVDVDLEEPLTQKNQRDKTNKNTDNKDNGTTEAQKQSIPDPKSDNHTIVDIKDDPEKKPVNNLPSDRLCTEYLHCDCSSLLTKATSKLIFQ